MQEVTVGEDLQALELEEVVALEVAGGGEPGQIEGRQLLVEQAVLDALLDVGVEVLGPALVQLGLGHRPTDGLLAHRVEQQTGGGVGVVGLLLDAHARREHQRLGQLDRSSDATRPNRA